MNVQFYTPKKHLSGLINVIWEQDSNETKSWKIVPSGFVELIFRIDSNFAMDKNKIHLKQTSPVENFCFLSGLHTKPLYLNFSRFKVMGIQLHPVAVKALFGIPTCKLRNTSLEGKLIVSELNQLEDVLKSGHTFHEKARCLEKFIYEKVDETPDLYKAMKMSSLMKKLIRERIRGKEIDWQAHTGYSRTQTYRIFKDWYGHSQNNVLKLYQFVQSINQLHSSPGKLTEAALRAGYYDQSHFIRNFRHFAEMTPGDYKNKMTQLPGQLSY